jgi:hypothetical protein
MVEFRKISCCLLRYIHGISDEELAYWRGIDGLAIYERTKYNKELALAPGFQKV